MMRPLLVATVFATLATSAQAEPTRVRDCPRDVRAIVPSVDVIAEKAKPMVPRIYRDLGERGRKFVMLQVVWLGLKWPAIPGAPYYKDIATRLCGEKTAEKSWAVTVHFPDMPLSGARGVFFVVATKGGWRSYRAF